jgi:uncharacterized membrane protein YqhA
VLEYWELTCGSGKIFVVVIVIGSVRLLRGCLSQVDVSDVQYTWRCIYIVSCVYAVLIHR